MTVVVDRFELPVTKEDDLSIVGWDDSACFFMAWVRSRIAVVRLVLGGWLVA